jgi:catechol 2,3-dioxygenase-like lactoylglutathione lyase family enzyme
MRWLSVLTASAASLFAQTAAPNAAGVSLGHIHLVVPDPDAQKQPWIDVMGAEATKAGTLDLLKLPGIFIIVSKSTTPPTGGTNGSVVNFSINHIGFLVKDFAALKAKAAAAHLGWQELTPNQQAFATFPDDVRVEIQEDKSISTPITFLHIHESVPDQTAARAWYVKTFGGADGTRRNAPVAMIPGGEVDYLKAQMPAAPTKGRSLDHIGFEVKNLEAFCKKLEADGIKLDTPYRDVPQLGLKIAFITDPQGTRIELTEGLSAK